MLTGRFASVVVACVLAAFVVVTAACTSGNEPKQQQAGRRQDTELQRYRDELSAANARIRDLTSRNEELGNENVNMQARIGLLETRNRKLMDGYGTGLWEYDEESDAVVFDKRMDNAGVRDIVRELNVRFREAGEPKLIVKRMAKGEVVVTVDNEQLLEEGMGSSGATAYFAVAAASIASVPKVRCVTLDIGEGEHAGPETYCKDPILR